MPVPLRLGKGVLKLTTDLLRGHVLKFVWSEENFLVRLLILLELLGAHVE